ncbi:MAG: alcohol dehydrogenase catalytic domain-containing protein [Phycisphaerales bacterium]|nr:alcohol dehydrogenase catalytic domain-containing protein [Phycisphaerales bacterium]
MVRESLAFRAGLAIRWETTDLSCVRALSIQNAQPVMVTDYPDPIPKDGLALVRPTLVLIVQADIHTCRNPEHRGVPGHQFVGVVESASDQSLVGQRVVGDVNITDPDSTFAKRGIGHHDPDRRILGIREYDGCLSDRFLLPERNLLQVPDEIEDERAVFASQLAAAIHVSRVQHIEGKTFVTVLGGDLTALLCAQVMGSLNASVRMLTGRGDRLELCAKWGIKHRHLGEVGRRADQDIVIDTMTDPGSLSTAFAMARPRGSVILQSHPVAVLEDQTLTTQDMALIIERELKIYGSRCGQINDGLAALQSGCIDLSGLITKRVKFDDVMTGLRAAIEPEHIGVLIQMG